MAARRERNADAGSVFEEQVRQWQNVGSAFIHRRLASVHFHKMVLNAFTRSLGMNLAASPEGVPLILQQTTEPVH